jgi:hypothetical protein
MALLSLLRENSASLSISAAVGLLTLNSISPLSSPFAEAAASYTPQITIALVALGFIALKLNFQFVMLVCFLSSISLCDKLYKAEVSEKIATSTTINPNSALVKLTSNEFSKRN